MIRMILGAVLAFTLMALPAAADTTTVPLTPSAWTDIASVGTTVEIQSITLAPVLLTTGTSQPAVSSPSMTLAPGERLCRAAVIGDLYARGSGTITVTTGLGCGAGQGGAASGSVATTAITQTRVTLPAGSSQTLINSNTSRKSLRWQNTGTNPMTCAPGAGAVTAGVGMNYDGASTSSNQGGATDFDGAAVPIGAFSCISTSGTTVTVWEGN